MPINLLDFYARDFSSEVNRTRRYSTLARPFSRCNVTRLLSMGFH